MYGTYDSEQCLQKLVFVDSAKEISHNTNVNQELSGFVHYIDIATIMLQQYVSEKKVRSIEIFGKISIWMDTGK